MRASETEPLVDTAGDKAPLSPRSELRSPRTRRVRARPRPCASSSDASLRRSARKQVRMRSHRVNPDRARGRPDCLDDVSLHGGEPASCQKYRGSAPSHVSLASSSAAVGSSSDAHSARSAARSSSVNGESAPAATSIKLPGRTTRSLGASYARALFCSPLAAPAPRAESSASDEL